LRVDRVVRRTVRDAHLRRAIARQHKRHRRRDGDDKSHRRSAENRKFLSQPVHQYPIIRWCSAAANTTRGNAML
jgi:hypothetical protein